MNHTETEKDHSGYQELDRRLKNFIAAEKKRGRKISQKEFVIGLIEQALAEYEAQSLTQPATEE